MEEGYHRFKSVTDDTKHIGFTANGRQITFRNRTIHNENCYSFTKITPKQLKASKTAISSSSINSSSAKPKVTYMGSPLNGMPVGESQQQHHQHHHHHHHQQQQQQHPHRQQPRNKQHPQQQQQQHHKKQRHQRISKSNIIRTNKNKTQISLSNHHHQYHNQQEHKQQQQKQQQQLHHRHRHSQSKHQLPFHEQTSSPSKNHNFQSDQSEQNSADIVEQRIRAERTFRDNMHSVRRSHNNYRSPHNSHNYHYLQRVDVALDEMPTHQHQLNGVAESVSVAEAYTAERSFTITTAATTTTTEIDTHNILPNKKEFRIKKKSHLDKHRHRHHHGDYQSLTSTQYVDKMTKHSLNKSSDQFN